MRIAKVLICLVVAFSQVILPTPAVQSASIGGIVISEMYPGATGTATYEYVKIFNNSDVDIDITGWCVQYVSSSGKQTKGLGCFDVSKNTATTLWLPVGGTAVFLSEELRDELSVQADGYFKATINSGAGYIRLVDGDKNVVDMLGWGTLSDESYPAASAPEDGKALKRKSIGSKLQDTDNDAEDFISDDGSAIEASDVYERENVTDICTNIEGIQTELPPGFLLDEDSTCQVDSCVNLSGLQVSVPDGYVSDDNGDCTEYDACGNIPGIQQYIPDDMVRGIGNDCIVDDSPLVLNEIMPNPVGVDSGNEFIEIYNPSDKTIDLSFYYLEIGGKVYTFPIGTTISPGEYKVFSDSMMKFTLVNTSGRVIMVALGGKVFGDTGIYTNAREGESWAFIDGHWEYTNRPTPGEANLASLFVEKESRSSGSGLEPCPPGKFRNPETNRCKNITSGQNNLKPCAPNQYRNPETNRCKKIETSTLKPCKEGQYRNPETNRCKSVLGTSDTLKPCKEGQYRNPETNRCRKKESSSVPDAGYKVQPVDDPAVTFVGWSVLGGVVALAGIYAVWEWRREMSDLFKRLIGSMKR